MRYDGKLLAKARTELENIKQQNLSEQQRRRDDVYRRCPEIRRIDGEMRAQMAELVRLTIAHDADLKSKTDALRDENLSLQMRRAELLNELGHEPEYLDAIYSCTKCRDTGIYEGGVCSCLERLYNRELTKELGTLMRNGDESFEKFDLRLYPEAYDAAVQAAPREVMTLVLERCRKYAESFPNVSLNLLFQGGTGLGKTYLSACIARVVAENGFSVCYDSASAALESYERAKFGRDTEDGEAAAGRVRHMESCDLMILDDLGTEMVTPMSLSALYTLINTRLVNGRKMIISTNCSDDELAKKYTPQICSRIAGEFISLPFVGQDIRKLKRGI